MSERKPWFPSNGTEGDFVQTEYCDKCKNDDEHMCPLIEKAMIEGGPIQEWSAVHCNGAGFNCDNFIPKEGEKK